MRISGTVWWFRKLFPTDENPDSEIAYPPKTHRPKNKDGSDLLERVFLEPELGPCFITKLGPIMKRQMLSQAQKTARAHSKRIALVTHHTLYYRRLATHEEHYSSANEIVQWIMTGPILQWPTNDSRFNSRAQITQPGHLPGQTRDDPSPIRLQHYLIPAQIQSGPHELNAETPDHSGPPTAIITAESGTPRTASRYVNEKHGTSYNLS
jgi:hypothetical protein